MKLDISTRDRYTYLIGTKVKGFKYGTHKYLLYNPNTMNRHLGEEGTIGDIWIGNADHLCVSLYFKSVGTYWSYPLEGVLEQLGILPESSYYEIF